MKTLLSLIALVLLSSPAQAGITSIARLPLLNISGTGTVKPNLMLLYDNSGSMAFNYTPDYINDTTTCRSRKLISGGTTDCSIGHPPFTSPDFNKQYYNPEVVYTPPVRADGSSYASQDAAATTNWTAVTIDGFGINKVNFVNQTVTTTNIVTGFPDKKWCDPSNPTVCKRNTATYTYPDNTYYDDGSVSGNPYYYKIHVAEYCTDANLTTCVTTVVDAPAPAGYPFPAKVRWCNTTALTTCQAKYDTTYKYPHYSSASGGELASYGTVTINASTTAGSLNIASVTVGDPAGATVITNGTVNAPNGTGDATKRQVMATAVAASIIAKTGLTNPYVACVKTPSPTGTVPACSNYGITLNNTNIVAVIPISCPVGFTNKSQCSVLIDDARSGWPLTVDAPSIEAIAAQPSTAILTISGKSNKNNQPTLASMKLGATQLLGGSGLVLPKNTNSSGIATAIKNAIGSVGTITAYIGGTTTVGNACAAASTSSVCLVDSAGTGGAVITMGSLTFNTGVPSDTNNGNLQFSTSAATVPSGAVFDSIPTASTALSAGATIFERVDIVPGKTYPKGTQRGDCAAIGTCTYDEEMTNFANWYGYYRTRNQMMKTAVGQAFQALTANYKVGIVSLSTAQAEGAMTPPAAFEGAVRTAWYSQLYAMDVSGSTPLRTALHAVGKMYAARAPYNTATYANVVEFPCQQNFTFLTTDGYWNGGAAADVVNNDNVESVARFCTRGKACVDTRTQTVNSLADIALYWYNGGTNGATTSLRDSLENWTKPGLVPGAAGDNTRLHMNTYTLGLGIDGVMNYELNYDTSAIVGGDFYNLLTSAPSGCPWNSGGAYIWPDPKVTDTSSTVQARVDDLWHAAINGRGKYFSASDPQQVVTGLSSALANIQTTRGAAAAAATSTPNISLEDNDIFSATFTTVKWYGELTDKKIDTVTGNVSSTISWSTSDWVGRMVDAATDTRRIKFLDAGGGGLRDFLYAELGALEKGWFDNKCSVLAQCPALSADNKAIVNGGANIVNWLRGQQQYANDTVLRAYTQSATIPAGLNATIPIVLGDIASSKPAFLREPRKAYTLSGYADFKASKSGRRATVFAAANDGMLHAFDATTGQEDWAYVPRITMQKLHLLASTTYGTNHQFFTDGSPELGDVEWGGTWKTILVAGLNGGGRGFYAIDVTDPSAPVAMWELCADATVCANNDPDLGLSFGNPQFGKWNGKWVVYLTSGYNNVPGTDGVNSGDGVGYLYIVDVSNGHVLKKVSTASGSVATPSGLAKITAISSNPVLDPVTTFVYGGDNQGQMWRFNLTDPGAAVTVSRMGNAGSTQPITTRPDVTSCKVETVTDGVTSTSAQTVVVFGTGRLLDVPDVANTDVQTIYAIKDSPNDLTASEWRGTAMVRQTLSLVGSSTASNTYTVTNNGVDLGSKSGWYVDLNLNAGERVNLDPKIVAGTVNVVSNMPSSSSACSVGGTSNIYQLDTCTGSFIENGNENHIAGRTLSNTSASVGFINIQLPDGSKKIITTTADGNTITTEDFPKVTKATRKVGWRRVKN